MPVVWDAPPMAEATAKPATPIMSVFFGPIMSAIRPPSSSRLPPQR